MWLQQFVLLLVLLLLPLALLLLALVLLVLLSCFKLGVVKQPSMRGNSHEFFGDRQAEPVPAFRVDRPHPRVAPLNRGAVGHNCKHPSGSGVEWGAGKECPPPRTWGHAAVVLHNRRGTEGLLPGHSFPEEGSGEGARPSSEGRNFCRYARIKKTSCFFYSKSKKKT